MMQNSPYEKFIFTNTSDTMCDIGCDKPEIRGNCTQFNVSNCGNADFSSIKAALNHIESNCSNDNVTIVLKGSCKSYNLACEGGKNINSRITFTSIGRSATLTGEFISYGGISFHSLKLTNLVILYKAVGRLNIDEFGCGVDEIIDCHLIDNVNIDFGGNFLRLQDNLYDILITDKPYVSQNCGMIKSINNCGKFTKCRISGKCAGKMDSPPVYSLASTGDNLFKDDVHQICNETAQILAIYGHYEGTITNTSNCNYISIKGVSTIHAAYYPIKEGGVESGEKSTDVGYINSTICSNTCKYRFINDSKLYISLGIPNATHTSEFINCYAYNSNTFVMLGDIIQSNIIFNGTTLRSISELPSIILRIRDDTVNNSFQAYNSIFEANTRSDLGILSWFDETLTKTVKTFTIFNAVTFISPNNISPSTIFNNYTNVNNFLITVALESILRINVTTSVGSQLTAAPIGI